MRITLIYPLLSKARSKVDENKQYWPPLGLAYLAAFLEKKGHSVQILDRDLILRKNNLSFENTDKLTMELINEFNSDCVGISMTTPNVTDTVNILNMVKNDRCEVLTVIGGPHCTGEPLLSMKDCKNADILVKGEGEETLAEIADGKSFDKISGIAYRDVNGSIKENPDRELIRDIDILPFPARHLLDMRFYLRPSRFTSRNLNLRTSSIFTARGCPFKCHYCAGPLLGRGKVRFHSPERVIDELNELIDKYNVEAVYFAEDMFLSNKERAKNIFKLIKDNGIQSKIVWMAQLSSNVVDEEYLGMMKEAGCVHVEFGFESGSQRVLELMNKKSNVGQNLKAAKIAKKVGVRFQGNFIVGFPGEKEEDFMSTINFIKKTKPSHVAMNMFMPLPGTAIYKKLKAEGKTIPSYDDIGNPDVPEINYADMSKERFSFLYDQARLRVLLPLNFYSFLRDNIRNPFRLTYILTTQFKGVLVKTVHSYMRLRKIN